MEHNLKDELAELASLPPIAPSSALDVKVREQGHAALAERPLSLSELLLYRVAVPTLLCGFSVSYLVWAVQVASSLY